MIDQISQNTPEWFQLRIGSIGGSGINKAVAKGKTRTDYLYAKASEIITGQPTPGKTFQYADRGHQYEDEALDYFAFTYGLKLKKVAIRRKTEYKHVSPDSLVIGCNRAVEAKVRLAHVFLQNRDKGTISTADRRQLQWEHRILGTEMIYRIQYCPELPDPLFVQEISPNPKEIEFLDSEADKFIEEMKIIVEKYRG